MTSRADIGRLWLPISSPRLAWAATATTFVAYATSMAPDLGFFDSPLLATAAVQFGLAHPPGQPLHTILGGLLVRALPWLSPLKVLSGLSAAAGALSVVPALSLAERMFETTRRAHDSDLDRESVWARRMAAVVIVLGALHAALWEQSTRIEVYALAVFLALWCLARVSALLDLIPPQPWPWISLGLALGLAASANPIIAIFALLAGAPAAMVALYRKRLPLRAVAWIALGGVLGLAPYAYIPLIAGRQDVLVWGVPRSGETLVHYLTARDFAANLRVPLSLFFSQLAAWVAWSYQAALLPVWALGIGAHLALASRGSSRLMAATAALVCSGYIANYAIFRPEVPDYVSYVSIASWLAVASVAGLAGHLVARGFRVAAWAVAATVLGCALLSPPALFTRTRSGDHTARALILELTQGAPPGSIFVLSADHWVAPFLYMQEAERWRPDLVLVATGLASSSWHWQRIYQQHPELTHIEIPGPGGKLGRIARFLAAQPGRRIFVEEPALAARMNRPWCPGRVLPELAASCEPTNLGAFGQALAGLTQQVDIGEPTSLGALADVSQARGLLLWAHGYAPLALPTLLAGIPPAWGVSFEEPLRLAEVPPLFTSPPSWQHQPPIGDPAQNLFLAAQIAQSAGAEKQARTWLKLARDHGLAEAAERLDELKD